MHVLRAWIFKYIYIYSYFDCLHYELIVVRALYWSHHHTHWRSKPNLHLPIPERFVWFSQWCITRQFQAVTYVTQPNIGCQYLVLFVLEWHNWERSFVWWLVSIVFTNDTKSTICWRASPNVKLMGDFSSTTGLDVQTFSKKKTVIWILRLKHISKAKTIPLKAVVREQ